MKQIKNYIEDVLIFVGIILITSATYLISFVASIYVLGGFLILLGIFFSLNPPSNKERKRR
ncbi:hypothetical protein [Rossellomorea sp. BNER]|uniref:hypothetical protein n=1 Tax=Rossellomorea sp. BNER TaxID=2962031 RepID=UPI003AF306B4|nr:hypothetical protein [Rossellomorea sp. BNER]